MSILLICLFAALTFTIIRQFADSIPEAGIRLWGLTTPAAIAVGTTMPTTTKALETLRGSFLSHTPPPETMIGYIALAVLAATIAVLFHSISTSEARAHSSYAKELAVREDIYNAQAQRKAKRYSWYRFVANNHYHDKRKRALVAEARAQHRHQLRTKGAAAIAVVAVGLSLLTGNPTSALLTAGIPPVLSGEERAGYISMFNNLFGQEENSGNPSTGAAESKSSGSSPQENNEDTMETVSKEDSYSESIISDVKDRFLDGTYAGFEWLGCNGSHAVVMVREGHSRACYQLPLNWSGDLQVHESGEEEMRTIELKGQETRLRKVFELLDDPEANRHAIERALTSLGSYVIEELDADLWLKEVREAKSKAMKRSKARYSFTKQKGVTALRRICALAGLDFKFAKVIGAEDELTPEKLSELVEEAASDDNTTFNAADAGKSERLDDQSDPQEQALKSQLVADYSRKGYRLLGGNPDKGLVIFVKEDGLTTPAKTEMAQRMAKILLRGGINLTGGEAFEATLVHMPEELDDVDQLGGFRDGIFLIATKAIGKTLAKANGFNRGSSWQGHFVRMGESLMKGMMLFTHDSPDYPIQGALELLKAADTDAVIAHDLYTRVYDTDKEVGDTVTVRPEDLWVMEVDDKESVRIEDERMRLSFQLISRAPKVIQTYLAGLIDERLTEYKQALKSRDKRSLFESGLLGMFGSFLKMAASGMRPVMKRKTDSEIEVVPERYANEIAKTLGVVARKGVRVRGALSRVFYDKNLSDGQVNDEDGTKDPVGISVPSSWGLEKGDWVIGVRYPVLAALAEDGSSTGIVPMRVEHVHSESFVGVHPAALLGMLGDEDGDKLMVHIPESGDLPAEVKELGVSNAKLSTKVEDSDRSELLTKELGKESLAKENASQLKTFLGFASKVGSVDNTVTSALLYMTEEELQMTDTPTGETRLQYMARCPQAAIEGMKWTTKDAYSEKKLGNQLFGWLPKRLFDEGRLVSHPLLDVIKPKDENGRAIEDPTLSDIADALDAWDRTNDPRLQATVGSGAVIWAGMVRRLVALSELPTANEEKFERGFAPASFYQDAAHDLFEASGLVSFERADALSEEVDAIAQEAQAIRRAKGESTFDFEGERHFLQRRSAEIRLGSFLPAEEFMLDLAMLLRSTSMYQPLHFCSTSTLKIVALHASGEKTGMDAIQEVLDIDGRNKLTSSELSDGAKESFSELVGISRSGRTSAYVKGDIYGLVEGQYEVHANSMDTEFNDLVRRYDDGAVQTWSIRGVEPGKYRVTYAEEFAPQKGQAQLKREGDLGVRIWRPADNGGEHVPAMAERADSLVVSEEGVALCGRNDEGERKLFKVRLGDGDSVLFGEHDIVDVVDATDTSARVILAW